MKIKVHGFSAQKKNLVLLSTYTCVFVAVLISAQLPLRQPVTLPWTRLDAMIPFFPWTIFIYLGHFPFVFLALFFLRDAENINRVAASMILATALTMPIFLLVPTVLPAAELPTDSGFAGPIFAWFRPIDLSFSNCFPSMHVGYAYLTALGYRDEQRRWYPAVLSYATLIALSTLLSKQHYVVDIPAGALLAWGCRWIVDHGVEFRFQDVAEFDVNNRAPHDI